MSGTHPAGWSYERYLAAKVTVDDRALNRNVVESLRASLSERVSRWPLRVVEIGGGTGTMVRRAIAWGLLSDAEYTLVDADEELLENGLESLERWASQSGLGTEVVESHALRLRRPDGSLDVTVRCRMAEAFEYLAASPGAVADLLVASAFLDLVELPRVLPPLLRLLVPGGLFWFPINFDGETIFTPPHPLDGPLMAAYHRTMDERVRYGRPAGDHLTGRKLFHALPAAGGEVHAAGSSDWVVHARDGAYSADEAYFVDCILSTIEAAVRHQKDVDGRDLASWLSVRRGQLREGTLVYLAHQLDFVGSTASIQP